METNTEVTQNMKLATEIFEEYEDVISGTVNSNINDRSMVDDEDMLNYAWVM